MPTTGMSRSLAFSAAMSESVTGPEGIIDVAKPLGGGVAAPGSDGTSGGTGVDGPVEVGVEVGVVGVAVVGAAVTGAGPAGGVSFVAELLSYACAAGLA